MMKLPRHPNKHINAAIRYAISHGWMFTKSKGHAFGRIKCGVVGGICNWSVWSTPRSPENHARFLIHCVDTCRCADRVTE